MYDNEGCILVSSSGLLVAVVLQDDQPVTATTWVGRGRRRLCHADVATASSSGEFLLATCGDDTPITVYTVTNSLDSQERHSGYCVTNKFAIIYWPPFCFVYHAALRTTTFLI